MMYWVILEENSIASNDPWPLRPRSGVPKIPEIGLPGSLGLSWITAVSTVELVPAALIVEEKSYKLP